MTFLEAAVTVLRTAQRPLTAREITETALAKGLIQTNGKTPEATMSARLYGASPESPVKREYDEGATRARRGSVRWCYKEPDVVAKPRRRQAA